MIGNYEYFYNDPRSWWFSGERHRLDGPAVEYEDGTRYWFIYGKQINTEEIEQWIEDNAVDISSEEGKMALKLRWI